jgi:uncharacterized iron-regulated membrane protein
MKPTSRKLFLQVHLWAGLTVGLLLIGAAISGAMLVFRPQLDAKLNRHLMVVAPGRTRLAPDDLVARARAVHPAGQLESIRYYGDPTAPFLAYFTTKDYVHLNPYTGEVLGVRQRYGDFFGWFEGFHKFLQIDPGVGENITGYSAMVFGGVILTGMLLWWPATRRALKAGLRLNPKLSGRPWNLNLHKTVGVYAAAVVLLSVCTGVPIALDWVKDALYPLTASQKEALPPPAAAGGAVFAGFNAIAPKLEALWPVARETYIPLPKKGVVSAYVIAADAPHPYARSYAWYNPADASALRITPYAQASRGFRLYYWMMSLHTGMMGGWVVQVMFLLGALSVPLLAYTGTASYLKRRFGRSAAKAPVASLAGIGLATQAQAKTSH